MQRSVCGIRAALGLRTGISLALFVALLAAAAVAPVLAQHQRPTVPPERLADVATPPASAGDVGVLPVQGNIYMLHLNGVNIVAQVGEDGILLVDTGPEEWSDRILRTLRDRFGNKPIRYIINTHVHPESVGGNGPLMKAAGRTTPTAGGGPGGGGGGGGAVGKFIAHENTLNRMNGSTEGEKEFAPETLPTSTFFTAKKEIYFNGEPIEILYQPAAHTDGDLIVFFRGSDVIAAGDLFSTVHYPILDAKRGGTIQGHLNALNRMLDITVPRFNQQGGTMVIPGTGRLCNESDVDDYRNWMTIVRDRIQAMVKKGMTLEQVKAAKPTLEYDALFSVRHWTTDQFVEAVYQDLRASGASASSRSESN